LEHCGDDKKGGESGLGGDDPFSAAGFFKKKKESQQNNRRPNDQGVWKIIHHFLTFLPFMVLFFFRCFLFSFYIGTSFGILP